MRPPYCVTHSQLTSGSTELDRPFLNLSTDKSTHGICFIILIYFHDILYTIITEIDISKS